MIYIDKGYFCFSLALATLLVTKSCDGSEQRSTTRMTKKTCSSIFTVRNSLPISNNELLNKNLIISLNSAIGPQCKNSVRSIPQEPAVLLRAINFGIDPSTGGVSKKTFFLPKPGSTQKCTEHDEYAVAYLSNFSINNNFSHFLHSLLRLFCALIDARFIEWDPSSQLFIHRVKYSIWLDEYFRLTKEKQGWLRSFYPAGKATFRLLSTVQSGQCVSSSKLLYGSGCVRLLPPGAV